MQLPDSIGGCESFTIIEDELALVEDDGSGDTIEFQFDSYLDLIIDRVQQESSSYDLGKIYDQYMKVRKWKTYTRLFKSLKGGKLKDNDPDDEAIGPMFEMADFSCAGFDNDLLMPIVRILDPWKEVFYSHTQVIRDKLSYAEIITLRKETWISDATSECFLDILNHPRMGLSSKVWVLNYSRFVWIIQSRQSIRRFFSNLPLNCSKILIFIHSGDHYMLVEVAIPSKNDKEVSVYIADSAKDEELLDVLTEEVRNANVDVFAASFNLPIRYHQVRDVVKQNNDYDCGICCTQRAYFYKCFDDPITIPQEGEYLKNTVTFRLFMLVEILKFYRNRISPLVYCDSPIHRSPLRLNIDNVQVHNSEEINVAGDLLNLSAPNTNLPNEAKTSSIELTSVNLNQDKNDQDLNTDYNEDICIEDVLKIINTHQDEMVENPNSDDMNEDITKLNQDEMVENPNSDMNEDISKLNQDEMVENPNSNMNEDISKESSENKQTLPNLNQDETYQTTTESFLKDSDAVSSKETSRMSLGGKGLFMLGGGAAGIGSGDDDSSDETATIVNEDTEANDEEVNEDNEDEENEDDDDDDDGNDDQEDNDEEETNQVLESEYIEADNDEEENEDNEDDDDGTADQEDNNEEENEILENEDREDNDDGNDSDYVENIELANTSKVTTRRGKISIITKRKIGEETEPASVAASTVEYDETPKRKQGRISPKQTLQNAIREKKKKNMKQPERKSPERKSKAKAVSFVDEPTKKKPVYGNKKRKSSQKSTSKEQERLQKAQFKAKERLRETKLTSINNEIERWETWHDVPPDTLEIDIFSDKPNYFIDQKVPARVQTEMNHDINRMKTKMYEPLQYDFDRAKDAVDAEFRVAKAVAEERHSTAEAELESIADQPNSAKYKRIQKTVLELQERKKFLKYTTDTLSKLLPFDAVYGIRTKRTSNGKEYFVIAQLADGSLKEKLVTRAWIEKHVEKDYLDRYYQAEEERGWILFRQEDADGKMQTDTNELRQLLLDKSVQAVYQYKNDDDDERVHCVRVAVTFKNPYHRMIPNSINWAIMTEKTSVTNKKSSNASPWNNMDDNDQKHHIYWDCRETLLQAALGQCFDLIKSAVEEHWQAEYRIQGRPHMKPKFNFGDNPTVEFLPNTIRFIDQYDLSKGSFLKNKPAVFKSDYCGIFSHRQYYYFDLRELATHYFVNVNTRQICGIYYDPTTKRFTGLEKFREKGKQKFKKVELETEWVNANIDNAVKQAAISKAKVDQKRFIKLPVGLNREMQSLKECRKNPKIVYPQYGEDTCVFASLSSALYYLQYEDVALQIDDFKKKIMKEQFHESFENLMGRITGFVHDDKYFSSFRQQCEIKKISHCTNYDLIQECKKRVNVLHHVVIISQDGGENHAICVVHNLIFDGNYTHALPLSQEYLNKSCDSTYLGIASGYRYSFIK